MSVLFVTGTGTEVGKTWFATRVITALREGGTAVVARKPAQSFEPDTGPTDADLLGAASGEDPRVVCPAHRWYEVPMAPPMAAAVLGRPAITIAELVEECRPAPAGITVVEGAGGPRSPIAEDGDSVDLARALGAERVLLVADAGLGTINAVRLCVETLRGFPVLVALNRFDPADDLHLRNRAWLVEHDFAVTTSPAEAADLLR